MVHIIGRMHGHIVISSLFAEILRDGRCTFQKCQGKQKVSCGSDATSEFSII
jgi:hypothetical protein